MDSRAKNGTTSASDARFVISISEGAASYPRRTTFTAVRVMRRPLVPSVLVAAR